MALQESIGGRGRRRKVKDNALSKNQSDSKRALYHCNYCQKDISHVPRIKCAECKDFDLCLECFSVGVEIKPHKNTHDYQVVENLSFPIFHPDWGADEELLLLEAIDMFGLGNWAAVSEHVGGKTPMQCKQHYFQVYIDADSFPLPTPTPEMAKVDMQEVITRARQGQGRKRSREEEPSTAGVEDGGDVEVKQEDLEAQGAAGPNGTTDASPSPAPGLDEPGPCPGSTKGLKRQRHELEEHAAEAKKGEHPATATKASGRTVHHDPLASPGKAAEAATGVAAAAGAPGQAVVGKVPSGPTVKPSANVDATGFHVKRNEFDPEYDNDAEVLLADMEFGEDDSEVDVQQKVAMLHIYNKRLDERERRRAFVLEHGLLNTKAAQMLERRRNTQEKELHARMRVFARYQSQEAHAEMAEGLLLEARLRSRIAELREYRRNGIRTFADAEVFDVEKRRSKAAHEGPGGGAVFGGGGGRGAGAAAAKAAKAAAAAAGGSQADDGAGPSMSAAAAGASTMDWSRPAASVAMGRGAAAALLAWRAKRGVPLDISCLPGVEVLSSKERELCATSRLLPSQYLALKDMLMRDCDKHGHITRAEARTFFRLEATRALRIYDLLVSCGWITSGPKGSAAGQGANAAGSGDGGAEEGGEDGEPMDFADGEETAGTVVAAAPAAQPAE